MRGDRPTALRRAFAFVLALGLGMACFPSMAREPGEANDELHFDDGSVLHGKLVQLDVEHGLRWKHPAAVGPIDFLPNHIDDVRFSHPSVLKLSPTCHVRFANGDDLFGGLTALDDTHVELTTWFGDKLSVPRSGVRSVSFLSKNYTILYEGPYDSEGWIAPPGNGSSGWHFRDSAFVADGPGLLGRDLGLKGSSTVEFDLTWQVYLSMAIDVYCDTPERIDYNSSSYLVQFTSGRVTLQRLRATSVPRNLGSSQLIPSLSTPSKLHVVLQFNQSESTVNLFIDGTLIKQWKDEDGFSVSGGGIVFEQGFPSAVVRVSDLRVSSWEGRHEPEIAATVVNTNDVVRFINHDKAVGKIQSIRDGNMMVDLPPGRLTIPLERLTQIDFATTTNVPAETTSPWTVRAFFPGGGSLSFELEKWSNNMVEGHSPLFGRLAFQPTGIRELEFNLTRPRNAPAESPADEFQDSNE